MVLLAIVYMFNFIDRQILAILLPAVQSEFGFSDLTGGLLTGTAFALFYVTLGIPIARVADRVNRRNLIALAVAVWSGMTALCGLAATTWQLALARIGVGVGEAGCSPPAHSMISDLYPPEQRSTAMGFYSLGISTGVAIAYMAGGWVAQNIGWREAFLMVGIPGLLLAAIVRLTMTEPQRGASEKRIATSDQPSFVEVLRYLLRQRSFWHMCVGAGLSSFIGYAVINWTPSFLARSFGMTIDVSGFWLGLIIGSTVSIGYLAGGHIMDRVAARGRRRSFNLLAVSMLVTAVLYVIMFLAQSAAWVFVLMIIPSIIANAYLPTVFAQVQGLATLRMRAVSSALMLLLINVIGLAMGSPVTGAISDALQPAYGDESLRYALVIVCAVILPWAALHYYLAGRTVDQELAKARDE